MLVRHHAGAVVSWLYVQHASALVITIISCQDSCNTWRQANTHASRAVRVRAIVAAHAECNRAVIATSTCMRAAGYHRGPREPGPAGVSQVKQLPNAREPFAQPCELPAAAPGSCRGRACRTARQLGHRQWFFVGHWQARAGGLKQRRRPRWQ